MDATREFVTHLTSSQSKLYAFILSLVIDPEQAKDILQNANVVLWEKSAEFKPGTNFMAWAYKVAYYEVRAARKRFARENIVFDEDLLVGLADDVAKRNLDLEDRLDILQYCLNKLPTTHREIVRKRYADGKSIKDIASAISRTANNVAVLLHRTRVALLDCIMRPAHKEGEPS